MQSWRVPSALAACHIRALTGPSLALRAQASALGAARRAHARPPRRAETLRGGFGGLTHPHPIPIRVQQAQLPIAPGHPLGAHVQRRLGGGDVMSHQDYRPTRCAVAGMLGQEQRGALGCADGDKPGQSRFMLVAPVLLETEPTVPSCRRQPVCDAKNRNGFVGSANNRPGGKSMTLRNGNTGDGRPA